MKDIKAFILHFEQHYNEVPVADLKEQLHMTDSDINHWMKKGDLVRSEKGYLGLVKGEVCSLSEEYFNKSQKQLPEGLVRFDVQRFERTPGTLTADIQKAVIKEVTSRAKKVGIIFKKIIFNQNHWELEYLPGIFHQANDLQSKIILDIKKTAAECTQKAEHALKEGNLELYHYYRKLAQSGKKNYRKVIPEIIQETGNLYKTQEYNLHPFQFCLREGFTPSTQSSSEFALFFDQEKNSLKTFGASLNQPKILNKFLKETGLNEKSIETIFVEHVAKPVNKAIKIIKGNKVAVKSANSIKRSLLPIAAALSMQTVAEAKEPNKAALEEGMSFNSSMAGAGLAALTVAPYGRMMMFLSGILGSQIAGNLTEKSNFQFGYHIGKLIPKYMPNLMFAIQTYPLSNAWNVLSKMGNALTLAAATRDIFRLYWQYKEDSQQSNHYTNTLRLSSEVAGGWAAALTTGRMGTVAGLSACKSMPKRVQGVCAAVGGAVGFGSGYFIGSNATATFFDFTKMQFETSMSNYTAEDIAKLLTSLTFPGIIMHCLNILKNLRYELHKEEIKSDNANEIIADKIILIDHEPKKEDEPPLEAKNEEKKPDSRNRYLSTSRTNRLEATAFCFFVANTTKVNPQPISTISNLNHTTLVLTQKMANLQTQSARAPVVTTLVYHPTPTISRSTSRYSNTQNSKSIYTTAPQGFGFFGGNSNSISNTASTSSSGLEFDLKPLAWDCGPEWCTPKKL